MGSPASTNGGGSPNQMAKDKAKRDAKKTANVEMGLGKDRMSNYSTSEGGTKQTGGDNNGNQVVQAPVIPKVVAPTTAEVSQATTAEADADTEENRLLKIKKKGRSITILNRAKGISSDEGLTLGKRSLLGS